MGKLELDSSTAITNDSLSSLDHMDFEYALRYKSEMRLVYKHVLEDGNTAKRIGTLIDNKTKERLFGGMPHKVIKDHLSSIVETMTQKGFLASVKGHWEITAKGQAVIWWVDAYGSPPPPNVGSCWICFECLDKLEGK